MPNFNQIILIGHLTRDTELRYLPSQTAVADFGIAITRKWKDQSGQMKDETCFVDCQAFGKPAETLNKYCGKGDPLMIQGRLKFESWKAQDGSNRSKHRVVVESFQLLKSQRSEANSPAPDDVAAPTPQVENDDIPF